MSERPAQLIPEEAPHVLLLRSPDAEGEDRYVQALAERGFRAVCRPVLRFAFAGAPGFTGGDVTARLRRPDRYEGLILTSPRASQALADVLLDASSGLQETWQGKPAFTVGPKTADVLRESGLKPTGGDSGDADALAAHIVQEMPNEAGAARPLLFLCGNRRREALPERLRAEGVAFEECVAYETHLREGPWLEASKGEAPDWAVFFSPSGVEAVRQSDEPGWGAVRKAALGPTTAGALEAAGGPPDAVAARPTPEALAEALAMAGQSA